MITKSINQYKNSSIGIFSASTLKILACIFMFIDHIGVRIFPGVAQFRIIGRLAYPIFAYFIAEGCKYTKNKPKRLFTILLFAIICELSYIFYAKRYYGNILFTFTLSIILIYIVQYSKLLLLKKHYLAAILIASASLAAVYVYTRIIGVDYGFYGVMVPVFVSLLDHTESKTPTNFKKLDRLPLRLALFSLGLILLILHYGLNSVQVYSIMAIPLLALYNGKPGVSKLKYSFYLFYPLHLAFIELIAFII